MECEIGEGLYFSRISLSRCFCGIHGSPSSCRQVLGVTSRELIPKGTRFGPLVGECYPNETLLRDANRKYFWRVSPLLINWWIFVKVTYLSACVRLKTVLHPVSPSGDAAVAVVWHGLAAVVAIWHPVKVWQCMQMLGYLLSASTLRTLFHACALFCRLSAWLSEVTSTAVWFQWRSGLSPLLSAVVSLPVNTPHTCLGFSRLTRSYSD